MSCWRCFGLTLPVTRPLSVPRAEDPQSLSSAGAKSRPVAGPRLNELLVEPGHTSTVVSMFLADLQETHPGHFATLPVEVVQHGEHHPCPAFTGPPLVTEVVTRSSGLVRGCPQQSFDPLEPAFDFEQSDLLRVAVLVHLRPAGVKAPGDAFGSSPRR